MGACAGEQPHFAEVSAIAASGRELLVQAPASRQVEAVVAAGETWREGCRRLLAKRNSGQRLGKCVKIMATGLERAVEQLQLRLQVRPLSIPQRPCIETLAQRHVYATVRRSHRYSLQVGCHPGTASSW